MIKRIMLIFVCIMLIFSTSVIAASDGASAGTTSKSIFWKVDLMVEDISLALTTDDVKRTHKMLSYAQERLVEIEELAMEKDYARIESTMLEHDKILNLLDEQIEKESDETTEVQFQHQIDTELELFQQKEKLHIFADELESDRELDVLVNSLDDRIEESEQRITQRVRNTRNILGNHLSEIQIDRLETNRYERLALVAQKEAQNAIDLAERKLAQEEFADSQDYVDEVEEIKEIKEIKEIDDIKEEQIPREERIHDQDDGGSPVFFGVTGNVVGSENTLKRDVPIATEFIDAISSDCVEPEYNDRYVQGTTYKYVYDKNSNKIDSETRIGNDRCYDRDQPTSNYLSEFYCTGDSPNHKIGQNKVYCENGCVNGACVKDGGDRDLDSTIFECPVMTFTYSDDGLDLARAYLADAKKTLNFSYFEYKAKNYKVSYDLAKCAKALAIAAIRGNLHLNGGEDGGTNSTGGPANGLSSFNQTNSTTSPNSTTSANSTCYNSVQDGDEEGIDCGGVCNVTCDVEASACNYYVAYQNIFSYGEWCEDSSVYTPGSGGVNAAFAVYDETKTNLLGHCYNQVKYSSEHACLGTDFYPYSYEYLQQTMTDLSSSDLLDESVCEGIWNQVIQGVDLYDGDYFNYEYYTSGERHSKAFCFDELNSDGSEVTCFNGLKDADEEGIDCGGSCDVACDVEASACNYYVATRTSGNWDNHCDDVGSLTNSAPGYFAVFNDAEEFVGECFTRIAYSPTLGCIDPAYQEDANVVTDPDFANIPQLDSSVCEGIWNSVLGGYDRYQGEQNQFYHYTYLAGEPVKEYSSSALCFDEISFGVEASDCSSLVYRPNMVQVMLNSNGDNTKTSENTLVIDVLNEKTDYHYPQACTFSSNRYSLDHLSDEEFSAQYPHCVRNVSTTQDGYGIHVCTSSSSGFLEVASSSSLEECDSFWPIIWEQYSAMSSTGKSSTEYVAFTSGHEIATCEA